MIIHVPKIVVLATSVNHHEEVIICDLCDDAIVVDSTLLIHNQGESSLAWGKVLEVSNCESLKEGKGVLTLDPYLAHVRYIEETNTASTV